MGGLSMLRRFHYTCIHLQMEEKQCKCVDPYMEWQENLWSAASNGCDECVNKLLAEVSDLRSAGDYYLRALTVAAKNGHMKIVQTFLSFGANVTCKNKLGHRPLLDASKEGHIDIVNILVHAHSDKLCADEDNLNPCKGKYSYALWEAASKGHTEIVELLAHKGADINLIHFSFTPLHVAASRGYTETVKFLLRAGAYHVQVNDRGVDALTHAAISGNLETVGALLETGGNFNNALIMASDWGHINIVKALIAKEAETLDEALDKAIKHQNLEMAELLLQSGAKEPVKGKLPPMTGLRLLYAAKEGNHKMVAEICTEIAPMNLPREILREALFASAGQGNTKVLEILLSYGADIHSRNRYTETPLFLAICGGHSDNVKLLLNAGADATKVFWRIEGNTHQKYKGGQSALIVASVEGQAEIVNLLVTGIPTKSITEPHSAVSYDVLSVDMAGLKLSQDKLTNALCAAAENGHTAIVEILANEGGDINGNGYDTPLFLAAGGGHTDTVKFLLNAGTEINQVCKHSGEGALAKAAGSGHLETVRALLDGGININQGRRKDKTALVVASKMGQHEVVKYLLEQALGLPDHFHDALLEAMSSFRDRNETVERI